MMNLAPTPYEFMFSYRFPLPKDVNVMFQMLMQGCSFGKNERPSDIRDNQFIWILWQRKKIGPGNILAKSHFAANHREKGILADGIVIKYHSVFPLYDGYPLFYA